SEKSAMDLPSPAAGVVAEIKVKVGDQIGAGDLVLTLRAEDEAAEAEADAAPDAAADEAAGAADDAPAEADGEEASADDDAAAEAKGKAKPKANGRTTKPANNDGSPTDGQRPASREQGAADTAPRSGKAGRAGGEAAAGPGGGRRLLVLGAGPGGYTAAFRAADLGFEVTLVERYERLGGVCLNVGCIPSKALLHAARVIDEAADMAAHGVRFGPPKIELDALRGWKDDVVRKLTDGLATLTRQRKVRRVTGVGRFTGPHELTVDTAEGQERLRFDIAIIAAGSQATRIPDFPYDDHRLIDSTGALALEDIPDRLLVVGGGIIGLEMATVYHALGSRVSVVEMTDSLIPPADRDLVKPLHQRLAARYEDILLGTRVTRIERQQDGLLVHFQGEQAPAEKRFDRVLVAVGRRPNGKRIGAEEIGVRVHDNGLIGVDRQMRTSVPHIYAIGDLVAGPMLAHKAMAEAKIAAEAAAGEPAYADARTIPSVAYTDPEIAWAGLTETQAKAQNIAYEKGSFPWAASGRALGQGRPEGLTKLLFSRESGRLIGGGIVGVNAGELIGEVALAIEMGSDAEDIGLTIHPHPTLTETVHMSAEAVLGTLTDLYLPRRRG
ncbi:MAG TPA: dihydrolipoyl dehydrogenase, partial [Gammaproteobacteria bacterium]|nr:dihydrolipoyl dehydrogenase [Gammaproteobacteria bacterium]